MILNILNPSGHEFSLPITDNIYYTNQAEDLRLRKEVASIRQFIQNKEINYFIWKPTELQLADLLTKSTAFSQALQYVLHQGNLLIDLNNLCTLSLKFDSWTTKQSVMGFIYYVLINWVVMYYNV